MVSLLERTIRMDQYHTYEATDFILDDWFIAWVQYPTAESERFWQEWLLTHPDRADLVEEARFWIQNVSVKEQLPADQEVQEAIAQIQLQMADDEKRPVERRIGWLVWQAAAAILLLIGMGWYFQYRQTPNLLTSKLTAEVPQSANRIRYANTTSQPVSLTLSDGSQVILAPKSQVTYPPSFAAHLREIELKGEAFFQVVRRPEQPFVVHTGLVKVRVLGTSFTVKAYQNAQQVSVAVQSGKVAVSRSSDRVGGRIAGVLLTPNQQVSFSTQDQVFRKSLVEAPILIDKQSQETDFVFDEEPIEKVFQQLETAYNIDLMYDAETLKHCTLSAHLSNEPLYQKLNKICQAIGATHETVGTQIIIHSEGCNP